MSTLNEWDDVFRSLADDPAEYERGGNNILLVRQGKEYDFRISSCPGVGLTVEIANGSQAAQVISIETYVQQVMLDLPRLAKQIVKLVEKSFKSRPGEYIESTAMYSSGDIQTPWNSLSHDFSGFISTGEPGSTNLLFLMAPAGRGKTVLLEKIALDSARSYQPDQYPVPLMLPVDLLGRYVGTIDDAIAGALNNTYLFPGLTQRDVLICIRKGWLALALDGFDELVARVGTRDAFLRLSDLLDQLRNSGVVILSARESFFDLYQISSAIRSYMQPKTGTYKSSIVRLNQWGEEQGKQVLRSVGSTNPEQDLNALLAAFSSDRDIVLHPFFLTRLARLWVIGERFTGGDLPDSMERTKYVIETFIKREATEKWVDREGREWIPVEMHTKLLGGIAEEMWKTGAYRLSAEELKIIAEFIMSSLSVPRMQAEPVLERIATHGAFIEKAGRYSFVHDCFLSYYFSARIAQLIIDDQRRELADLIGTRDLPPDVIRWIVWNIGKYPQFVGSATATLDATVSANNDIMTQINIGKVCAKIAEIGKASITEVSGHLFHGDSWTARIYENLEFTNCKLYQLDLTNTCFKNCKFNHCDIGPIFVNRETSFSGTTFVDCHYISVDNTDQDPGFSPEEIEQILSRLGAKVIQNTSPAPVQAPARRISQNATKCLEGLVKASMLTCDIAVDEMEDKYGDTATEIVKIGIKQGILRKINKGVSGPRREFVRFVVDRELLRRAQAGLSGNKIIDAFWNDVAVSRKLR